MVRDGAVHLLTMRVWLRAKSDDLILRSGRQAASRRMDRDKSMSYDKSADEQPPSRGATRPKFCKNHSPKIEGAGNAGRPMRPIAARAMAVIERTRVSQVTPEIARHSPRNGFNGFLRALPSDRACLPLSLRGRLRET